MGFELGNVLSDESHHGPFLCAICQNLCGLDALVTTSCSHVFCRQCLGSWINRPKQLDAQSYFSEDSSQKRCPTCNADLAHTDGRTKSMMIGKQGVDARLLEEVQPLAYRVLRRVKVKCPLYERHGCQWEGDYGDVQEHLVSATAHQSLTDWTEKEKTSCSKRRKAENDGVIEDAVVDACDDNQTQKSSQLDPAVSKNTEADLARLRGHRANRRNLAQSFKEEANEKFSTRNFVEARDLYSKGLSVMDDSLSSTSSPKEGERPEDDVADKKIVSALRANRAAAYLELRSFEHCIEDCEAAIHLDSGYEKAYIRKAKALTELGRFEEAFSFLREGCVMNPSSPILRARLSWTKTMLEKYSKGMVLLKQSDFAAAKATFGKLMLETSAISVVLGAAWADCGLGLTESALRFSLQAIRADNRSAEGYEVRGCCMYLMGEFDNSMSLLRESIRLDPDCSRAKNTLKQCRDVCGFTKEAQKAFFTRKFDLAVDKFTASLERASPIPPKAPIYGKLHSERAEAYLRLKNYDAALKDCALAIYAQDSRSAWLTRAKAYHAQGRHKEVLEDMQGLMRKWGADDSRIRAAYEKADFEVRKEKRPDFYGLFGVPKISSEMEIKKAYKVKAKEFHPDRLAGDEFSESDRLEAEMKFKLLGEGLEILCDDFKRQLYDEGYDQEAIRERVSAAQQAARRQHGRYQHGSR